MPGSALRESKYLRLHRLRPFLIDIVSAYFLRQLCEDWLAAIAFNYIVLARKFVRIENHLTFQNRRPNPRSLVVAAPT
jgi:hypothetical protein